MFRPTARRLFAPIAAAALAVTLAAPSVDATVVRFDTVLGNIDVELFDQTTPATVANFLTYATAGDYICSIFHRSTTVESAGLDVLQGGGFFYEGQRNFSSPSKLSAIETNDPVINEPGLSNRRGTIAMAKNADPNSATSQFYFNLTDAGQSFLDDPAQSHEGFTVFGEITDGLDVLDTLAALTTVDFADFSDPTSGAFREVPVRDYTQQDFIDETPLNAENLAIVRDITIIDSSLTADSAADHLRIVSADPSGEEPVEDLGSQHVVPGQDDSSEPLLITDGEVLDAVSGSDSAVSADAGAALVAAGGSSASQSVSALASARTVSNPEPATAALIAGGLLLAARRVRRSA